MARPFPNITDRNYTDFVGIQRFNNEVVSPTGFHYWGDLMVMAIWIVAFGMFVNYFKYQDRPMFKAMIVSSFAAFVSALLLDILGLIDYIAIALPVAAIILSITADKIMEEL